jgi:hypothetical protein
LWCSEAFSNHPRTDFSTAAAYLAHHPRMRLRMQFQLYVVIAATLTAAAIATSAADGLQALSARAQLVSGECKLSWGGDSMPGIYNDLTIVYDATNSAPPLIFAGEQPSFFLGAASVSPAGYANGWTWVGLCMNGASWGCTCNAVLQHSANTTMYLSCLVSVLADPNIPGTSFACAVAYSYLPSTNVSSQ